MRPDGWEHVRRILVVRLDNIGDMVMLSPALRALRQALPEAQIKLLASPAGSQVVPLLPWVDNLLTQRVVWQDASAAMPLDPDRELALVAELRAGNFDAALIFTSFSQSPWPPAYACYLAGIPIRIGQSKEFGGSLLTHWVRSRPDDLHQAERNLHLLEAAGFQIGDRSLELHVPPAAQAAANGLLRGLGLDSAAPFVLVAPGASCQARRYDAERFAEVSRLLAAESGLPLVIVASARERETIAPALAAADGRSIHALVGKTSIAELAAIIRRAALVVANDSGPMHIADAFRRPSLILYSGTEYESQWRPRSAPALLLRRPTDCSPCYLFRCPYSMECLEFSPREVADRALELLEQHALGSTSAGVTG